MIPKIIFDNNIAGGEGFRKLPLKQTTPVLVFRKNLLRRFSFPKTILYLVIIIGATAGLFLLNPLLSIAGAVAFTVLTVVLNQVLRYEKVIVIPERELRIYGKSGEPSVVLYDEIESFRFYVPDADVEASKGRKKTIFIGIDIKDGRRIPFARFGLDETSRQSLLKLFKFFRFDNNSVTEAFFRIFGKDAGKVLADEYETQVKSKKIPKKIDNFLAHEIFHNKFISFEKPTEINADIDASTQKTLALQLLHAKKMFGQNTLRQGFFTSEKQKSLEKYDLKKPDDQKKHDDSEHVLDGFWKIIRMQKAGGVLATVIKRPIAVLMVVIGVLVFGWISYERLALMLMPPLNYPTLTVRTDYPAASPEIVEEEISNMLEENLGSIENLVAKSSISRPERSEVYLEFKWGTNISQAATEVRQKFGRIRLPMEAENPLILKYDPTLEPIMRLVLLSTSDDAMSSKKALRNTLVDL
ncbi:MAG: efflux RND transporter permease subunit, partial [Planctomycetes bacterium]|nr:efflux RND transporter permease subunit [Planctomycetota bacterium]